MTTQSNILTYLKIWWSRHYQLPIKHPTLQEYTLEELTYEYYAHNEYDKAIKERIEHENVKIEEEQLSEANSWADKMEEEELKENAAEEYDPTQDPDNVAWMEDQMAQAKEMYGENFGEDISEVFE